MKNLKKLSVMDYTTPVGNICAHPSKIEAHFQLHLLAAQFNIGVEDAVLLNVEIVSLDGFRFLAWGSTGDKKQSILLPVFEMGSYPSRVDMKVTRVSSGEVFICENLFYRVCDDPVYKQILRQIAIFADEDVVRSALRYVQKADDEPMDFYLINITNVNEPNKILCPAWMVIIHHDDIDATQLFPVFSDDLPKITKDNINSLNWSYLHEGDCFTKDNTVYEFCRDKNNKAYIAQLMRISPQPQSSD